MVGLKHRPHQSPHRTVTQTRVALTEATSPFSYTRAAPDNKPRASQNLSSYCTLLCGKHGDWVTARSVGGGGGIFWLSDLCSSPHQDIILTVWARVGLIPSQWLNANRFDYQTNLIVSDKPNSAPQQTNWISIRVRPTQFLSEVIRELSKTSQVKDSNSDQKNWTKKYCQGVFKYATYFFKV